MPNADTSLFGASPTRWTATQRAELASGAAERVAALDVLRGVMALAVAVYHFAVWTHALDGQVRTAAIVLGLYSVEGFFIISGFCFFRVYGRTRFDSAALTRFHIRRFLRIAPLFYCAIVLTYLVGRPVNPAAGWDRLASNLTLTFALFHPNHALVLGGWSIGLEYLFYLVFPALAWVTRRRGVLYALVPLAAAFAVPYTFGRVEAAADADQFNLYVQLANHAFLFALGGVIADLHERIPTRIPMPLAIGLCLSIWFLALATQPSPKEHVEVVIGATRVKYVSLCFISVLLCAFGSLRGELSIALKKLGDSSYSVYLMHPFAWFVSEHFLSGRATPLALLLSGVTLTLAFASCTQHWIERPAIALGRRLTRAQPRAPSASAHSRTTELPCSELGSSQKPWAAPE